MKRITLEIVRDGLASGRLLSPSTNYIGLCENHPPSTFHLAFDHVDLLRWQRDLRGKRVDLGESMEVAQGTRSPLDFTPESEGLERASYAMAGLLDSIPTLATELGPHTDPASNDPEVPRAHLRVVMAPLELASLPLECARAPLGFRGAGLFLTRDLGVSITREIQRYPTQWHSWRDRPRILLASTDADPNVPLAANVAAIMKALRAHLGWHDHEAKEASEYLQVRPKITLDELAAELAAARSRDRDYTHIHLLGHGVVQRDELCRASVGIEFQRKDRTRHFVSGEELATALRPCGGAPPSTLTLAVCDGGGTMDVLSPTGSIAHHLHANGFPLVIASQFPLTFEGSVVMTETFYTEVLKGKDPRHALYCTRRALHTRVRRSPDWAALLAYASFSDDIERQIDASRKRVRQNLSDVSLERAAKSLLAAGGHADLQSRCEDLDRRFAEVVERMKSTTGTSFDRVRAARHVASMSLRWLDVLTVRQENPHYRRTDESDGSRGPSANVGERNQDARPPLPAAREAEREVEGRSLALPLSQMNSAAVLRQAADAYAVWFRFEPDYIAFVQGLVVKAYEGTPLAANELSTAGTLVGNAMERALARQDEPNWTREEELARVEGHQATLIALGLPKGIDGAALKEATHACLEKIRSIVRRVGARSFQAFGARRDAQRFRSHGKGPLQRVGESLVEELNLLDVPREWKSRAG